MNIISLSRRRLLKFMATVGVSFSGLLTVKSFAESIRPEMLKLFKGVLVMRNEPAYLRWFWAMTWYDNKPKRFPAIIAQPKDMADIKIIVDYAKQSGLRIALRSSGHNITQSPLRKDAITLDMSLFNHIELDEQSKTVWAGPGVLSQELNEFTFPHGLIFPGAHTGFVAIGGFLLGGGMGWNMPAYGMACGSVLAAEIMLADGSVIIVSEHEYADLYWALRGVGPGFFAIVLRYKLQLYPAPLAVMNTFYIPLNKIKAGIDEVLSLVPKSNKRSEILGALGRFSPPGTPEGEQRWHLVLNVISFGKTKAEAINAAEIFNESKLTDICVLQNVHNRAMNYLELFEALGSTDAYSTVRTSEIAFFTEQPDIALPIIAKLLESESVDSRSFGFTVFDTNPTVPEPCSFTYWAPHYISWYLIGTTAEEIEANKRLMKKINTATKPYVKGYYINEIDLSIDPDMVRRCFTPDKWSTLMSLRKKYDPENIFLSYVSEDNDS
ncbi:FAD-dependent oxidoreductase [Serratia ureilytica]|uniref:FAD-binding oxidoreductase n=1 Tax=Serratia ureilytica TaxID=300181 RepID=UPI0032667CCB